MPTINLTDVITLLQLGISAAKYASPVVKAAKDYITSLFQAGVITSAQQAAAHAHMDVIMLLWLNGQTPVAWTVEQDPEAAPKVSAAPQIG